MTDFTAEQSAPAPKTIVVCCDGTGNEGGAVTPTNVWRIREAVLEFDDQKTGCQQLVLYQDGVGTSRFRPLEILGKGLSLGITANLESLYARFIQIFRPGDRVYLFGFSRGAYTVRMFSDMLYRCGVAACVNDDGELLSPNEIGDLAKRAVEAYKHRHVLDANGVSLDERFRKRWGIPVSADGDPQYQPPKSLSQRDPEPAVPDQGRVPIEFVGVWDTVASVGVPFENVNQRMMSIWGWVTKVPAFRWATFAQLNWHRTGHWTRWKDDDLHCMTRNAFHALSVDDERQAFRPLLWTEFKKPAKPVKETQTTEAAPEPIGQRKELRVEQVWFAGMHANVGGGYAKDDLAFVSLKWMMDRATEAGLVFEEATRRRYLDNADSFGQIADSRSGLAMYYRYKPRSVEKLSREVGLTFENDERRPKIHRTTLERIRNGTDQYAPIGLPSPKNYVVIEKNGDQKPYTVPKVTANSDPEEARSEVLKTTYGYTRIRRGLYYAFFALTLAFLGVGLFDKRPGVLAKVDNAVYHAMAYATDLIQDYNPLGPIALIVIVPVLVVIVVLSLRTKKRESTKLPPRGEPGDLSDPHPVRTILLNSLAFMLLAMIIRPLAHWATTALIPVAGERLVGVLGSPSWFAIFAAAFYLVIKLNAFCRNRMRQLSVYAWRVSLRRKVAKTRSNNWRDKFAQRFTDASFWINFFDHIIVPFVAFLVLGIALAFPLWIVIRDAVVRMRIHPASATTTSVAEIPQSIAKMTPLKLQIDTRNVTDTGMTVDPRVTYVVAIAKSTSPDEAWEDDGIPMNEQGVVASENETFPQWFTKPLKRNPSAPYFQLVGSVDDPSQFAFAITPGVPFTVPRSGRLYLMINDVPGFYFNNQGTATLWIWPVTNP